MAKKKNILIVEDEAALLQVLTDKLPGKAFWLSAPATVWRVWMP